jgi:hypothetical protein
MRCGASPIQGQLLLIRQILPTPPLNLFTKQMMMLAVRDFGAPP